MEKLLRFVYEHMSDDLSRLILNKGRWPEIDMDLALACIESRRKLKGKVQEWHDNPDLVFPLKLSAEQCSSSATGRYKAELAERIAAASGKESGEWSIADLTGGFGVDSWYFSGKAGKVLYNEMQTVLCEAASHNFRVLGADNVIISNHAVIPAAEKEESSGRSLTASPEELLRDFRPDIIFLDPARRGEGGRKVFLIEECTPDILTLREELFSISRHILVKLSPMADISMVCNRLGSTCREVHIVSAGGECKELLIWMDREWNADYHIHAAELHNDGGHSDFSFTIAREKEAVAQACPDAFEGCWLFEPGKSLMKAGAFNLISESFGIGKLGVSTHYYIVTDEGKATELKKYGKIFRIIRCSALDKRSLKEAGKVFPRSEVTARNIPMDTETLRKKTGVTSGDDAHIFGLKSDRAGNLLIITSRA